VCSTVFIYSLNDPETGEVRYIGKCTSPRKRLVLHLSGARTGKEKSHRACWIRSLLHRGLKPILTVIDEVPEQEWRQWEVAYIQFFRDDGHRLTNSTLGGEGFNGGEYHPFFGKRFTAEHKRKLSVAMSGPNNPHRGRPNPEGVARMVRAIKGKHFSAEHRDKIAAANRGPTHHNFGKVFSAEHRRRLSESHRGLPSTMTLDARDRQSQRNRDRVWTDEMRQKSSHSAKLRVAKARMKRVLAELWR